MTIFARPAERSVAPIRALVALVLIAAQASPTMAEPTPAEQLAQAQQKKALADAQREALEAEKKRLEAQIALEVLRKQAAVPGPESQEAVAAAKAAKELADAQKAAIEAQAAADKARLGGVPDSGIAGTVTPGTDAGKLETVLLAHRALNAGARSIADKVGDALGQGSAGTLFVVPSGQQPKLVAVALYRAQRELVGRSLATSADAVAAALAASAATPPTTVSGGTESVLPATVGVALESITKLLGFFRSDFNVSGRDLAIEELALVQAVAGREFDGWRVSVPSLYDPAAVEGLSAQIVDEWQALADQRRRSIELSERLQALIAKRGADASAAGLAAEQKRLLDDDAARLRGLAKSLETAAAAYDALLGKLSAPDEATSTMLRDLALWTELKRADSRLLVLKVQASGGSAYTSKNLWTFFGWLPYYVAGGTVVSYTLMEGKTGRVLASGLHPVHGGFESLKGAADKLRAPN